MSYQRPIQVFTELKNNKSKPNRNFEPVVENNSFKMTDKEIKEAAVLSTMSRQITVSGVGEMVLAPDLFAVTIRCKSTKETIPDAKASVTRRVDYIIQTLKNFGLSESDFKVYTHAGHHDSHAQYESEIEAHFSNVGKCLDASNLLAEKLGPGVQISMPVCYHAQGSLDKLRKQAGMLAIYNARQKALEMARVIHLTVGQALQVQEDGIVESQGSVISEIEGIELNSGIQQKIAERTVKICSKVNVCFQLKSGKAKRL